MRAALSLFVAIIAIPLTASALSDVCYGLSGNEDTGLGVCDPTAETSACCNWGYLCYSNGLCFDPAQPNINATAKIYTNWWINGCTDATDTTSSNNSCYAFARCHSGGYGVTSCGADTWCCYGLDGCDCTNATEVFTLDAGVILTTLPASAPTTTSTTTSTTATTAALTSTTSTSTLTSSASTATTPVSTSQAPTPNNSVAVGAGVGAGIGGAIILLGIGVGIWYWRRREKANKAVGGQGGAYMTEAKYNPVPQEYAAAPSTGVNHNAYEPAPQYASEMYAGQPLAQLP